MVLPEKVNGTLKVLLAGATFMLNELLTLRLPEPPNSMYPLWKNERQEFEPLTVTVDSCEPAYAPNLALSELVGTDAPIVAAYIC